MDFAGLRPISTKRYLMRHKRCSLTCGFIKPGADVVQPRLATGPESVSTGPDVRKTGPMTPRYAQRMDMVRPSAIGELLALGADPSIISFGGGYPDASLFPTAQLDAVFQEVIRALGGAAL